ncbi:uncharacterized protein PgNI_03273 [Pyricularia grisea]|uniref:Uncharacterized protein n=1 Tax=Pyricularia grisea TaxID=148305 RepID=A0A6P8B8M4_PYRGI|nr:uncharacterized protein PgNI_03273 [Pyricularia grisea]TLD12141.1 hypothetical protein PgNI_03273 [Pyricularia grisea]
MGMEAERIARIHAVLTTEADSRSHKVSLTVQVVVERTGTWRFGAGRHLNFEASACLAKTSHIFEMGTCIINNIRILTIDKQAGFLLEKFEGQGGEHVLIRSLWIGSNEDRAHAMSPS